MVLSGLVLRIPDYRSKMFLVSCLVKFLGISLRLMPRKNLFALDQILMGDLENLEIEARRMEKKRKGNEQERKSKRRKLDRLVAYQQGWKPGGSRSPPPPQERIKKKLSQAG